MGSAHRLAPWLALGGLALVFLFLGAGFDLAYIIPRRLARLGAIVVGGVCVAWSAIVFQTLTGNRILTPAVMGYEAVHLLLQATLILAAGTRSLALLGSSGNVALSVALMLGYSWALHRWLLRHGADTMRPLLLGLVLTLVIGTFTQFVQLWTSPGEFSILLGLGQASFDRAQPAQVLVSGAVLAVLLVTSRAGLPALDVMALGRELATSLGVDTGRLVRRQFALVAVLVAISTSLLGPTAFMGIFVANAAYAVARSTRHRHTLPTGCGIAIGMFLLAQIAVEHVFNYRATVGILVNLACGAWFLGLMLRTRHHA